MERSVLEEAKRLNFIYQLCEENYWHILPQQPKETWKLTEADSRWILSIKTIPQRFCLSEVAVSGVALRGGS